MTQISLFFFNFRYQYEIEVDRQYENLLTSIRLRINFNLIHNSSCIEPMRIYPLRYHGPITIHCHFEYAVSGIQTVDWGERAVSQGRVQSNIRPGWNASAVTFAFATIVETIKVYCVAEDVGRNVPVADRWHETCFRGKTEKKRSFYFSRINNRIVGITNIYIGKLQLILH